MTSSLDGAGTDVAPVISDQTLQIFASMAAGIPEADDSEAYESIVSQLLGAAGVDDLNAPWETEAADRLAGHQLQIKELTRRPSDYIGGLGMYLVAKGVDQANGERFVWTTGSIAIVAQLARAYFLGGLPIIVQVIVGDANPRTGRKPQHLQIVALGGNKPDVPADGAPF